MNHYPHHIGDFNNATRHLSRLERSIYRDLLDMYYDAEQPLLADLDKLARRALVCEDEKQALKDVLTEFFTLEADGWHNKRCDEELAKFKAMSDGGKRGAEKRWAKAPDSPPMPTPLAPPSTPHAKANSNQNQNQNQNQEPREEKKTPSALMPDVSETVLKDWMDLRRAKKAPVTATAIAGIRREAQKAGISMQQALETACQRGWVGFKAEWVRDGPTETSYQRSMRERVEQVAPMVARKDKPNPMEVLDDFTRRVDGSGLRQVDAGLRPRLSLEVGGAGHGRGSGGLDEGAGADSEQPHVDPIRA